MNKKANHIFLLMALILLLGSCRKEVELDLLNSEFVKTFDFVPTKVMSSSSGFIIEAYDLGADAKGSAESFYLEVDERGNILWKTNYKDLENAIGFDSTYIAQIAVIEDAIYMLGSGHTFSPDSTTQFWFGKLDGGNFTMITPDLKFASKNDPNIDYDAKIVGNSSADIRLVIPMYKERTYWVDFHHLETLVFRNEVFIEARKLPIKAEIDEFYEIDGASLIDGNLYLLIEGFVPEYLFKFSDVNNLNWVVELTDYGPFSDDINWEGSLGSRGSNLLYLFYMDIRQKYNPNTGTNLEQQKSIGFYQVEPGGSILESDTIQEKGIYNNYRIDDNMSEIIACGSYQTDINIQGTPFRTSINDQGNAEVHHFIQRLGMYLLNVKDLGGGRYLVAGGHGHFKKSLIEDFFISVIDTKNLENE